jgi:DNA polymerase-3 subunit epsilon
LETIAVIDFETTGLSPERGDRATEVAAVLIRNGKPIRRYQNLMNAGVKIPGNIQALTGITNEMIAGAPSASTVMREVCEFVEDFPLVAHNAAFDKRFWDAEVARVKRSRRQEFACSMLIARRILPHAPSHKLGELAAFAKLPATGRFHRAEADAEMAAQLLGYMAKVVQRDYKIRDIDHDFWCRIQRTPAGALHELLANY